MRAGTRVTKRPHTCVRLQPSAPSMQHTRPRFRRHRRGHHVLRHRCEQSTVSPTESAARKRAAATAVAGEGVTQTGAEAPSPEHLVSRRPHVLTRSCTRYNTRADARHPNAYRKPTGRYLDALHNACASKRRAACERPTRSRRRYCAASGVHACCGRTYGPSHLHSAEACQLDTLPPCSGYHPMGSRGVVEPGARAVGANGIERCPPHVYP